MNQKSGILIVCTNRKAFHDYFILETFEAGLSLLGAEVKSIRQKELSLDGAFVRVENGQATLLNMYVKPYKFNSLSEPDPVRTRQLLLNKREIRKLHAAAEIKGQTIVPLEIYFKNGWAKVKLALAKGKHLFDRVKFNEHIAITMSCKMSVKGNEAITLEEAENLLNDLVLCDNPYNCPHGSPTIISFTIYELERMFKIVMN